MRIKQKQGLGVSLRTRLVMVTSAVAGVAITVFLFMFGFFNTAPTEKAEASTSETIPTGSFMVNMGVSPQTFQNGLLPYGMIYDLTQNYNVPIKWVINPAKVKDGNDFTHNGVTYRGSSFIIPANYITPTVASRITYWQAQGVIGNYSVSSQTLPVYMEITSFPLVIIDTLSMNDTIIAKYYQNAGIPATAFVKGSPEQVNSCHDMWVNPHGDPTWATHSYLYNFVTVEKSFIWMQCHAVSMMESCKSTSGPAIQLNYLSTDGLQCYAAAKCQANAEVHTKTLPTGTNYFYPTDPVMQFIGGVRNVAADGSERWFIPKLTGGWRTTTKRLVTVGTTTSPREGVIMVYGPAYGDSTNGMVMYMGGHDMNSSTTADRVAAQRSYFNFLLIAGKNKAPVLSKDLPGVINANATDTMSVSVTGGATPYSYSWTSSAGGNFSNPNGATTTFTAPHTVIPMTTTITCVVTDNCGRRTFFSQFLNINASALPITLMSFTAKPHQQDQIQLNWVSGIEKNNEYFTLEKSKDGRTFSFWRTVPSKGNSTSPQSYFLVDENPFNGSTWYRLSQTDYDGASATLGTIRAETAKSKETAVLRVSPNPFRDEIFISGSYNESDELTIRLFTINGRLMTEKKVISDGQQMHLNGLSDLPSGTYLITVTSADGTTDKMKLLKQ